MVHQGIIDLRLVVVYLAHIAKVTGQPSLCALLHIHLLRSSQSYSELSSESSSTSPSRVAEGLLVEAFGLAPFLLALVSVAWSCRGRGEGLGELA